MDMVMVHTIVGYFLAKGLKGNTVLTYMAAVRQAHAIRGLDCACLSDNFVKAALRGQVNKESLAEKAPRAVATVKLMRQLRDNLKRHNMGYEEKLLTWVVVTWMLMGSLRGSELLGKDHKSFDPVKTLL